MNTIERFVDSPKGGPQEEEEQTNTLELTGENYVEDTPRGLTRLLACCGILKTPALAEEEERSFPNASEYSYEEAVSRLLRQKSNPQKDTFTHIKHIRQSETWDCGIACLQMILRWLRCTEDDYLSAMRGKIDRAYLLNQVATQSIWTVDLIMLLEGLLKDNSITTAEVLNHNTTSYLFCSQVWGVNTEHSTTGYYEQAFVADSARVNKLCEEMNRLNLPILCPYQLEFQQMINLISNRHCIAILLVDNHVLMQEAMATEDSVNGEQDTYMGHYVVVCGISTNPDHLVESYAMEEIAMQEPTDPYCIAVANPGVSKPIMFVNPQRLERAWRANGTDCDVIFIAKHA